MWHVDEGTLHAFLDDRERGPAAGALDAETRAKVAAHLQACDVCSAQLQRAERQRARAAEILLAAAPEVETPPFEAVTPKLAPRAAATGPARSRRAWMPLAWAATLVLAVGAGWMSSRLWRGGDVARPEEEAARPAAAAPVQTAAAPAPTPVTPPIETSPSAARSAASPQPLGGISKAEGRRADAAVRSAEADAAGQQAGERPTTEPGRQLAAAATALPAERRELAAADVAVAQQKAAPPAAGAAAQAVSLTGAVAANAAAELPAAPRAALGAAASAPETGYPGDADVAWASISREAAEKLLGGPLYQLADAAVLEIAAAGHAQPPLVRVRQRAAGGEVELLQWRQPVPAVKAEALREVAPASPQLRASPLASGRARDGSRFITMPGTSHPVLLRFPSNADLASLLPRVRPAR